NLTLRLRRRYVAVTGDETSMSAALRDTLAPLAAALATLLELSGKPAAGADPAALLEQAAEAFDLDRAALRDLAELKQNPGNAADLGRLYAGVLRSAALAAGIAEKLVVGA